MTVGGFKSRFAEVQEELIKSKRKLGLLEGKAKVTFKKDFNMSEEEFSFNSKKNNLSRLLYRG